MYWVRIQQSFSIVATIIFLEEQEREKDGSLVHEPIRTQHQINAVYVTTATNVKEHHK